MTLDLKEKWDLLEVLVRTVALDLLALREHVDSLELWDSLDPREQLESLESLARRDLVELLV